MWIRVESMSKYIATLGPKDKPVGWPTKWHYYPKERRLIVAMQLDINLIRKIIRKQFELF